MNKRIPACIMMLALCPIGQAPAAGPERESIIAAMKQIGRIGWHLETYQRRHGFYPPLDGPFNETCGFYRYWGKNFESRLPGKDPWGHDYLVFTEGSMVGKYQIQKDSAITYLIVCLGQDGKREDWEYDDSRWDAGRHNSLDPDLDIVYLGGDFIRANRDLLEEINR